MPALIALTCNHCGAPLDLSAGTRFATCAHCGSRLVVSETGGAYVTAVLGELAATTDRMDAVLRAMQLRDELDRLDAEWAAREENNNFPAAPEDTELVGRKQGGLAILCGFVGLVGAIVLGMSDSAAFLGLVGVVWLLLVLSNVSFNVRDREVAEQSYVARRAALVSDLRAAELVASSQSELTATARG